MDTPTMIYRVRPGDTLSQIAERFGTNDEALYHANYGALRDADVRHGHTHSRPSPNRIFAGTPLVIPDTRKAECCCCCRCRHAV